MRLLIGLAVAGALCAQGPPAHGTRIRRLLIHNATVVDGNGTPARGPMSIVVENGVIADVIPLDPVAVSRGAPPGMGGRGGPIQADAIIDATGKYVLPGLINAHGHLQEERGGKPQPLEYELNLWLASGITTVRDVGSDTKRALELRRQSAEGQIAAPRLFLYPMFGRVKDAAAARARVRDLKQIGADGIKIMGLDRDLMEAMMAEAKAVGLRVAHHAGVEETNAWDDIRLGTTSIEHWYGIPDAAIEGGVQNFPASYNYNNEVDRFRYAGRLWREAKPELLTKVLEGMVKANVAWDPTLDIYEASRDLQRAQSQPWFAEYLHPTLEAFFKPNLANHGSYFLNWTSTDEAYWKENYRIWMAALRQFGRLGGLIGVGDDAGFIYQMYGIGLIRSMELHEEAGFHPIQVIQQATQNNARILGQAEKLGRVRAGFAGDLIVVNRNPLEDLKALYPPGIEWTIKDGIPYHGATLMKRVKDIVTAARK